ncbi:hypothetical protein ABFX02_06G171200 [Erythranthe guttata]
MHESDEEETLSLCDLPLYSNSITDQTSEWEQFSASTSISSSSQDDDYFEFSSQEFTPSAAADFPPENIIFCGKLIPYKQPHNNNNQPMIQKANNNSNSPDLLIIESRKNRIEMWKNSSSSNAARGTTLTQSPPPPKKTYNTNKQINLSLFTSSSSSGKTKWYFLFFGSPRFSTEVDLRDFKSRRRSLRRQFSSPPPMFRFENQDEDEDEYDDGDGDFVGGGRNRRLGLWGMLIKVLSCGGGNHQSAAAASIGCSTSRATEA